MWSNRGRKSVIITIIYKIWMIDFSVSMRSYQLFFFPESEYWHVPVHYVLVNKFRNVFFAGFTNT